MKTVFKRLRQVGVTIAVVGILCMIVAVGIALVRNVSMTQGWLPTCYHTALLTALGGLVLLLLGTIECVLDLVS